MPNFACRKNAHFLSSKKLKVNIQQSFQRILAQELAQELATSTNDNRVSNNFPPNEPMVESRHGQENAKKCMAERPNSEYNDGHQGMEEDSFSSSKTSFSPVDDDSMSSEEDGDPNNLSFDDDIFGLDLMSSAEGMNDDRQSLKTTTVHLSGSDVDVMPPTRIYQHEDQNPPTTEDEDIKFSDLDVAALGLMQLCDDSGARHRFFDDLLTLLHQFHKKRIDITKAKGRTSFLAVMQSKAKCPMPMSKKVGGCDVIYFPFFNSLQDLPRSTAFYDIENLCANKEEQD
jgi:hypothetical protein